MRSLFGGEKVRQAQMQHIVDSDNRDEILAEAEAKRRIAILEDLREGLEDTWESSGFSEDLKDLCLLLGSKWNEATEYPLAKRGYPGFTTWVGHPFKVGARTEDVSRPMLLPSQNIKAIHGQAVMYRKPIANKDEYGFGQTKTFKEHGFFVFVLCKEVDGSPTQSVVFGDIDNAEWVNNSGKAIAIQELQSKYKDPIVNMRDLFEVGGKSALFRMLRIGMPGVFRQNEQAIVGDAQSNLIIREQIREQMQLFIDKYYDPLVTGSNVTDSTAERISIARKIHEAHQGTALTAFDVAHAGLEKVAQERRKLPLSKRSKKVVTKTGDDENGWHEYFKRESTKFPLIQSMHRGEKSFKGMTFGGMFDGWSARNDALIELAGHLRGQELRNRLNQPTSKEEIRQAEKNRKERDANSYKAMAKYLEDRDA